MENGRNIRIFPNWKPDFYLDGIACSVHGFIADKKIKVFHAPGQPPGGLITDFGSFFHSYRTGYNELGLIVTRIPQFGIPEKKIVKTERKITNFKLHEKFVKICFQLRFNEENHEIKKKWKIRESE